MEGSYTRGVVRAVGRGGMHTGLCPTRPREHPPCRACAGTTTGAPCSALPSQTEATSLTALWAGDDDDGVECVVCGALHAETMSKCATPTARVGVTRCETQKKTVGCGSTDRYAREKGVCHTHSSCTTDKRGGGVIRSHSTLLLLHNIGHPNTAVCITRNDPRAPPQSTQEIYDSHTRNFPSDNKCSSRHRCYLKKKMTTLLAHTRPPLPVADAFSHLRGTTTIAVAPGMHVSSSIQHCACVSLASEVQTPPPPSVSCLRVPPRAPPTLRRTSSPQAAAEAAPERSSRSCCRHRRRRRRCLQRHRRDRPPHPRRLPSAFPASGEAEHFLCREEGYATLCYDCGEQVAEVSHRGHFWHSRQLLGRAEVYTLPWHLHQQLGEAVSTHLRPSHSGQPLGREEVYSTLWRFCSKQCAELQFRYVGKTEHFLGRSEGYTTLCSVGVARQQLRVGCIRSGPWHECQLHGRGEVYTTLCLRFLSKRHSVAESPRPCHSHHLLHFCRAGGYTTRCLVGELPCEAATPDQRDRQHRHQDTAHRHAGLRLSPRQQTHPHRRHDPPHAARQQHAQPTSAQHRRGCLPKAREHPPLPRHARPPPSTPSRRPPPPAAQSKQPP